MTNVFLYMTFIAHTHTHTYTGLPGGIKIEELRIDAELHLLEQSTTLDMDVASFGMYVY
jgi:hypothetical protein